MNKIELKNVSKAYEKNVPVIENLDLQIKDGSFTVLLGPSGCGKSTILRMIAGLEKETGGEIFIDGQSVKARFGDTLWRVRGTDCPAGTRITVVAVDGSDLLVRPETDHGGGL